MAHSPTPRGYFSGHAEQDGRVFQLGSGVQINAEHFDVGRFLEKAKILGVRSFSPVSIALADPLNMGVHRSETNQNGSVPEYISRSSDEELRRRVSDAGDKGGLVLLVGDSTAGKSRSAFEALRACIPNGRVWAPIDGPDLIGNLKEVVENSNDCFLWLDDLERYIGPDGLTPAALGVLKQFKVPVLATIRAEQYRRLSPEAGVDGGTSDELGHVALGFRVLQQLEAVHVPRLWDERELAHARQVSDGRVIHAVEHSDTFGIAEYLAAGPRLYQLWQFAKKSPELNPRGAALVEAAVDCVRAGITGPVPLSLLWEMHDSYLSLAGGDLLRPESADAALEWASRRRYGVTSLLLPIRAGSHYRAFDYLPDALARTGSANTIPASTWDAVLRYAEATGLSFHVGMAASQQGEWGVAERAWKTDLDAHPIPARISLGRLYLKTERTSQAKQIWREAVDLGSIDASIFLGGIYEKEGRIRAAVDLYRLGAEKENAHSISHLAYALPDYREAISWYLRIVDTDKTGRISYALGLAYSMIGDIESAKQWWLVAAQAGQPSAMNNYGLQLQEEGDERGGLYWIKKAADEENPKGLINWAYHLYSQGNEGEAVACLKRAVDLGDSSAYARLGFVEIEKGDEVKAEEFWRLGFEAGDSLCALNLGIHLQKSGDRIGAMDAYRVASSGGDARAAFNYAHLLLEGGDFEEAEVQFHSGIEVADVDDICNFGHELSDLGRYEDALYWLNVALLMGHTHAACVVGQILFGYGRDEEAERMLRIALAGGHAHAGRVLAEMLVRSGRGADAAKVLRAVEAGGSRKPRNSVPVKKNHKRKRSKRR